MWSLACNACKDKSCSCSTPFRQILELRYSMTCTSYRNESGWVKSSLQFCFIPWIFLFISLLGISWECFYVLVLDDLPTFKLYYISLTYMSVFGQTSGNKLCMVSLKIFHIVQPTFCQRWAIPWKSHSNNERGVW